MQFFIQLLCSGELSMDTEYWRDKLHSLKGELEALDNESAESRDTVELDQTKVGRLSRMDALQGQAMNQAVAARRKQAQQRIEAALTRLEEGEFGYCLVCGDEIPVKRLELDPAIVTCHGCSKA